MAGPDSTTDAFAHRKSHSFGPCAYNRLEFRHLIVVFDFKSHANDISTGFGGKNGHFICQRRVASNHIKIKDSDPGVILLNYQRPL